MNIYYFHYIIYYNHYMNIFHYIFIIMLKENYFCFLAAESMHTSCKLQDFWFEVN